MEKSIRTIFGNTKPDLRSLPSLTLAYVGDSAFELILRTALAEQTLDRGEKLHRRVQRYVSARGQARIAEAVEPLLTEEEAAVFRRGKNAHPESFPKSASVAEYLAATGLEALVGYLFLDGQSERAVTLVKAGMDHADGNAAES